MLLYEHPLSSYAQKVKIALREKGIAFDLETPQAIGSGKSAGAFAASAQTVTDTDDNTIQTGVWARL